MGKEININTEITLYELNKDLIKNELPLSKEDISRTLKELMTPFVKSKKDKFFMLLNRETYNFTLFDFFTKDEISLRKSEEEMLICLINRGEVISIEEVEDNSALEIWIKQEDEEYYVYYFFPYDLGVIEIGYSERDRSEIKIE